MAVCIRAKDTTDSHERTKFCAATDALVKNHSGIRRHLFSAGISALGTGDESIQFQHDLFGEMPALKKF
jgi:hypothetical protein